MKIDTLFSLSYKHSINIVCFTSINEFVTFENFDHQTNIETDGC